MRVINRFVSRLSLKCHLVQRQDSRTSCDFWQFEPRRCFFLLFFLHLVSLWNLGVRVLRKNGYFTSLCLAHETSLFKISAKKHVHSIFLVWRKLAEHNLTFINISYGKQGVKNLKFEFSKFPRSNYKIMLMWSTHIQPVPPMPVPYLQVSTSIYFHFWQLWKTLVDNANEV